MLLADIRRIFDKESRDRLSTQELLAALREDEDRPWHDYREEGFGITDKQLARLLKLFRIHPNSVRIPRERNAQGVHAGMVSRRLRSLPASQLRGPGPCRNIRNRE